MMEFTVLGCGDAFGNGGRNNTSFLVTSHMEHVLLDCGATTLVQLKKLKIDTTKISTIVISHFHGDHFGGLPFFLINSMFEERRTEPLRILGPIGVKSRVYELMEAMYAGTIEALDELDITFMEYTEGEPLSLEGKVISAWQVEHSPQSIPHGVRIEWNNKAIAYSGDTSWSKNLVPLSKGTDLFICECNFMQEVSFGHLSYSELMNKYEAFETKQLWLTHMSDKVIEAKEFQLNRLEDGQKIRL